MLVVKFSFVLPGLAGAPRELFQEANSNYWENNYESAAESFREFTERFPDHDLFPDAQFGLGQAYFELDRLEEAALLFQQVEEDHPDPGVRGDALYGQIQVALLEDEPGRALKLMENFESEYPDHSLAGLVETRREELQERVQPEPAPDFEPPVEDETDIRADEFREPETPTAVPPGEEPAIDQQFRTDSPPLRIEEEEPREPPAPAANELQKQVEAQSDTIEQLQSKNQSLLGEIEELEQMIEQKQNMLAELESEKEELATENETLRRRLEEDISEILAVFDTPVVEDEFTPEDLEFPARDAESYRQRARQALDLENYEVAWNNIQPVLEADPQAEDYYLAARITWEGQKDPEAALELLEEDPSEEPPVSHIILRAQLLLAGEKYEQLDELQENYESRVRQEGEDHRIAQWNYLLGRRLLAENKRDQAFFRFMEVIRGAPLSEWADESRRLISDEL